MTATNTFSPGSDEPGLDPDVRTVRFRLKSAADSIKVTSIRWGHVRMRGLVMGIGNSPRDSKQGPASSTGDAGVDEFFGALSPLLGDEASFPEREPPEDESPPDDVLWLLEENARLRALAVKLSNVLGDLPDRAWKEAVARANASPPDTRLRKLPRT
jgi:hypothetical protein